MNEIAYPKNTTELLVNLAKGPNYWTLLKIKNAVTIKDAVTLISQTWFNNKVLDKKSNANAIGILFTIDGVIGDELPLKYQKIWIEKERSIFISFESLQERKIVFNWTSSDKKFFSTVLSIGDFDIGAVGAFFREFFSNEIKNERIGKQLNSPGLRTINFWANQGSTLR